MCVCVFVRASQVKSGLATVLAEKMRGTHFCEPIGLYCNWAIHLPCPANLPSKHQPALLRAQLACLQGCTAGKNALTWVKLYGYTITSALVRELAALPNWCRFLHFIACPCGPDAAQAYMSLAAHVHSGFERWGLQPSVSAEMIMCLCMGVVKHREAGSQPLYVHWSGADSGKKVGRHVEFQSSWDERY